MFHQDTKRMAENNKKMLQKLSEIEGILSEEVELEEKESDHPEPVRISVSPAGRLRRNRNAS